MQFYTLSILVLFISGLHGNRLVDVQRDYRGIESNSIESTWGSVSRGWTAPNGRAGRNTEVNVELPNLVNSGVQIVKQVPYTEILRLIESFLRLKGELGSRLWALWYDNGHILAALRDTLINKLSSLHNLTLKAIIILRKVMEFASALFTNVNVNLGANGGLFNAGVNFG